MGVVAVGSEFDFSGVQGRWGLYVCASGSLGEAGGKGGLKRKSELRAVKRRYVGSKRRGADGHSPISHPRNHLPANPTRAALTLDARDMMASPGGQLRCHRPLFHPTR